MKHLIFFTSLIFTYNCYAQKVEGCQENSGNGKLFVFIGEKIDLIEATYDIALDSFLMIRDMKFIAKYKVLERICGNLPTDTIEFIVYDHYGHPEFESTKTVMLYLTEYEGKYYHLKYQYHHLYKTIEGKWASPFNWLDYNYQGTSNNPVEPVVINFEEVVSYSTIGFKKREIRERFPEPYYKLVDSSAVAIYGNFIPELFELKKRGDLKERGWFGYIDSADIQVQDVQLEQARKPPKISKKERLNLFKTWNKFFEGIQTKNSQIIKKQSLDSVICSVCEGFERFDFYNDLEPIEEFIHSCYKYLPDTELWNKMLAGNFTMSKDLDIITKHEFGKKNMKIFEINFTTLPNYDGFKYKQNHRFQFIKVNGELKFYGMSSF